MGYFLGIDIGTSNTKAVAFSTSGETLAHANRNYAVIAAEQLHHELDPEVLFQAVEDVLKEILQSVNIEDLEGISFSAAMHGLIAVDSDGNPLTKMMTWADRRSGAQAAALKESGNAEIIYERTGTPIHPMSPLCKICWLRDCQPETFNKTCKFISIKELVFFRFFGEYLIDHSIASATGLFDIYDLKWNQTALAAAGIGPEKLSIPVPVTHIVKGFVRNELDIPAETPFVIGASDGCLAHIGSGALGQREVSITIGTSGAVRIMTDAPVNDAKQRIFNYVLDDGSYISGGPLNNGGNVLQWFASKILMLPFSKPDDFNQFIDQALAEPPGSDGLVFLPYIHGERAPVWDADARGIFYGVSAAHTRSDFMRAVMEGICFALREILETIEEISGKAATIFASGGFINSRRWVSMLADVLGRKITITQAEDSSAAGAAMMGMKALGTIGNFEELQHFFGVKEIFEPDMANHNLCNRNYKVYTQLYARFKIKS